MASGSLVTKMKSGRPYLYWVRSARVEGKPRIVEQVYLGPKDRVLHEIRDLYTGKTLPAPELRRVRVRAFGGPALLWMLAKEWDLAGIVDKHVSPAPPERRTSLSVGQYVVLAAINRALAPHSKRSFENWYRGTVLERLCPAQSWELTSQRFWDHLHPIDAEQITAIQRLLLQGLAARFPVGKRCLLYDTTNYYTYLSTFNGRCELAQRGHNKQKRADLRQLSLSLVVDEVVQLPLFHEVYVGNRVDATQFGGVVERLQEHFTALAGVSEQRLTLVFDKGNVSGPNLRQLREKGFSYVGAVPLAWAAALEEVPLRDYTALSLGEGVRLKVWRGTHPVAGEERTVVVVFSPRFFWEQRRSLNRLQAVAEEKLSALRQQVVVSAGARRPRKASAVNKEVSQIARYDRLSAYLNYTVEVQEEDARDVRWHWDLAAKRRLQQREFGKTVLITDREEWSSEQVVRAYRSQHVVEECFRVTKSRSPGMWWPSYHWTDNMLRVHALCCHFALLLLRIVELTLQQQGIRLSLPEVVERLNGISEALVVHSRGGVQRVIAEMTPEQKEVFRALGLPAISRELGNTLLTP